MSQEGFISLLETHDHLDELFLLHQEAVLVTQWGLAAELLEAYRSLLSLHIDQEEQQLLPLFERAGSIPRAPVVLFTGQHRKLVSQLERIATTLKLAPESEEPRRSAIYLLDQETAFKQLSEHHDGAEATYFYPNLAKMATERELFDVVHRCWSQWDAARAGLVSVVARAQQTLDVTPRRRP
jgi:hemerythrin-like domain-containing protein